MDAYSAMLAEPPELRTWPRGMAPDASAQFRRIVLGVDAGCRVTFVGGAYYEPVATFGSLDAAYAALLAAKAVTARLFKGEPA